MRRDCVSELLSECVNECLVAIFEPYYERASRRDPLYRHSRERGNPFVFQVNMDPRFRGDDVGFSVSFRGNDVSFSVPFVGMT